MSFECSHDVQAVIRTFNSSATLRDSIDSVQNQTANVGRIIVVDSGSTDDTLEIADRHGCRVIKYPYREFHYSKALNVGLRHVTAEYALILSSHVLLPTRETLAQMLHLFEQTQDLCSVSLFGRERRIIEGVDFSDDDIQWDLVTINNFHSKYKSLGISNSCNLIQSADWIEHPFNEEIPRVEDQEWLLRQLRLGRTAARVKWPPLIYLNPYQNEHKQLLDLLTLASYEINPTLTKKEFMYRRFRKMCRALLSGNRDTAWFNAQLLLGLIAIRFGVKLNISSRYF